MAKDIAALSGGDKTAFKAALGGMGYVVPISGGTIAAPVEYFDVTLPSGYDRFFMSLMNMTVSVEASDYLTLAFSADAGSTFFCDDEEFDTYGYAGIYSNLSGTANVASIDNDSLMQLALGLNGPNDIDLKIFPGSATHSPRVLMERVIDAYAANLSFGTEWMLGFLNPTATITPVYARMNLVRVLPYGDGDMPPTSGNTITGGSWVLSGIPTPA